MQNLTIIVNIIDFFAKKNKNITLVKSQILIFIKKVIILIIVLNYQNSSISLGNFYISDY